MESRHPLKSVSICCVGVGVAAIAPAIGVFFMPTDDPQCQVLRCINQSKINIEQIVELVDGCFYVIVVLFQNRFGFDRFGATP